VLIECGFLTNPNEAQYAQSSDYRQKLAQEIARGILNRPALAARTTYTNRSSRVDVGLQPFLDQRFMRESGTKHRRHKTATKKKSSSTEKKNVSSEEQGIRRSLLRHKCVRQKMSGLLAALLL